MSCECLLVSLEVEAARGEREGGRRHGGAAGPAVAYRAEVREREEGISVWVGTDELTLCFEIDVNAKPVTHVTIRFCKKISTDGSKL